MINGSFLEKSRVAIRNTTTPKKRAADNIPKQQTPQELRRKIATKGTYQKNSAPTRVRARQRTQNSVVQATGTRSGKERKRAAEVFHEPNALSAQTTNAPSGQTENTHPGDEKKKRGGRQYSKSSQDDMASCRSGRKRTAVGKLGQ